MKKNLKTPTRIIGRRRHGFRSRMHSSGGRAVISRRRCKGRKRITI